MVSTDCCPSSRICRLCSQSKTILGLKEDRACLSHGQRGPDKLHLLWDPASDAFRGVLTWEVEGPCYYLHGGKCWMNVLCLLLVASNHRCKYPDSKGSVGTRNKSIKLAAVWLWKAELSPVKKRQAADQQDAYVDEGKGSQCQRHTWGQRRLRTVALIRMPWVTHSLLLLSVLDISPLKVQEPILPPAPLV